MSIRNEAKSMAIPHSKTELSTLNYNPNNDYNSYKIPSTHRSKSSVNKSYTKGHHNYSKICGNKFRSGDQIMAYEMPKNSRSKSQNQQSKIDNKSRRIIQANNYKNRMGNTFLTENQMARKIELFGRGETNESDIHKYSISELNQVDQYDIPIPYKPVQTMRNADNSKKTRETFIPATTSASNTTTYTQELEKNLTNLRRSPTLQSNDSFDTCSVISYERKQTNKLNAQKSSNNRSSRKGTEIQQITGLYSPQHTVTFRTGNSIINPEVPNEHGQYPVSTQHKKSKVRHNTNAVGGTMIPNVQFNSQHTGGSPGKKKTGLISFKGKLSNEKRINLGNIDWTICEAIAHESFANIAHIPLDSLRDSKIITIEQFIHYLSRFGDLGILAKNIADCLFRLFPQPNVSEYITFLKEHLLCSTPENKMNCIFDIFDYRGKHKINMQMLFKWFADISTTLIQDDLLILSDIMTSKQPSLCIDPKDAIIRKREEDEKRLSSIGLWGFCCKRNFGAKKTTSFVAFKRRIAAKKVENKKEKEKENILDETIVKSREEIRKQIQKNFSKPQPDIFLTTNDLYKTEYANKPIPNIIIVLICLIYSEKLAEKICLMLEIWHKVGFVHLPCGLVLVKEPPLSEIKTKETHIDLMSKARRKAPESISEENLEAIVNLFMDLMDPHIKIQKRITTNSFIKKSEQFFGQKVDLLGKSFICALSKGKSECINFNVFFEFCQQLLFPVNKQDQKIYLRELSFSILDIDKDWMLTSKDLCQIYKCRENRINPELYAQIETLYELLLFDIQHTGLYAKHYITFNQFTAEIPKCALIPIIYNNVYKLICGGKKLEEGEELGRIGEGKPTFVNEDDHLGSINVSLRLSTTTSSFQDEVIQFI